MASGYHFPTIGRGKIWRNNKNEVIFPGQAENVEDESCNANIKNSFGITQEPWSFYRSSTDVLDEPITNFKFEYDDELEEEDEVSFQETEATKNVINILSGTSNYLADIDNLSTSTCGAARDQFFTSFHDDYNSSTPVTAKYQKQTGAITTTSTDYLEITKPSASFLKESPVKKLEEVSKCNKLPAPSYSLVSRKQTATGFVAVCEFLDYVATGYGVSQNKAREEAAVKMLKNLHIDDYDDDASSIHDCGLRHSFQHKVIQNSQNSLQSKKENEFKASHFQQSNLNLDGVKLCKRDVFQQKPGSDSHSPYPEFAMRPTGNKPYIWLLQSVASKMNFEVKYEVSPHRTSTGLAQCLVHLCKNPPIVCYGSAKSEYKAKSSAARCAFEYLKIVYQK